MDEKPRPRWYQLTIGRCMGATAWAGIFFGLICLSGWWKAPDTNPPLFFGLVAALFLSPFVAVGTLIGYPLRGLIAGILIVGGFALYLYIAINNGWIHFEG